LLKTDLFYRHDRIPHYYQWLDVCLAPGAAIIFCIVNMRLTLVGRAAFSAYAVAANSSGVRQPSSEILCSLGQSILYADTVLQCNRRSVSTIYGKLLCLLKRQI
jgi:hypothetical protein